VNEARDKRRNAQLVKHKREVGCVVELVLEVFDRFFFGQVESEFFLDLRGGRPRSEQKKKNAEKREGWRRETNLHDGLIRLELDIGDISVDHEADEVDDKASVFTETDEGGIAEPFKAAVVQRLIAPHPVNHLLAHLDRRRERLRVPP
jgi:hypothetical protein